MRKLLSGSGPAGAGPDSPGSCDDEHSQGASSLFPGLSTLPGPLTPFYTIIATLPEEVTELLGREKSERRSTVDSAEGYRNGYGKPRRLAMSSGTITLRRPRVRGVEERFESRVLPLFARRTKELGALLPELYLHGLAEGDFELAMRGLLGEGAPLSKSSIRRLRAGWTRDFRNGVTVPWRVVMSSICGRTGFM